MRSQHPLILVIALAVCCAPRIVPAHEPAPAFAGDFLCCIVGLSPVRWLLGSPDLRTCAPPPEAPPGFGATHLNTLLVFDNDMFYPPRNPDAYYTQGFRYESRFLGDLAAANGLPVLLNAPGSHEVRRYFGWQFGQEIYTPDDFRITEPQPDDRPYAAVLFLGAWAETLGRDESLTRFGLDVGVIGPLAGGKATQSGWHTVIASPHPLGWENQIASGHSLFGVVWRYFHRPAVLSTSFASSARWLDFAPYVGVNLGCV